MKGTRGVVDFHTKTLIRAIESNFWETWSNFGRSPGCTLHDEEDILWFENPIPILPYNTVLKFQVKKDIDQRIDKLIDHFNRRKVLYLWIVHPSSTPPDLPDRLKKWGLMHIEVAPCMARGLANLPTVPPLPNGIEVRETIAQRELHEFEELAAWRWSVPEAYHPQLKKIIEHFRPSKPGSKTRMWMAWKADVPLAKIASSYCEGSVGIYGVVTKPEARGQGLASILMVEAMRAAREAGHKLVVLHSSPLAENLYKRLGFVTVTQFDLFATESAYL